MYFIPPEPEFVFLAGLLPKFGNLTLLIWFEALINCKKQLLKTFHNLVEILRFSNYHQDVISFYYGVCTRNIAYDFLMKNHAIFFHFFYHSVNRDHINAEPCSEIQLAQSFTCETGWYADLGCRSGF